MIVCKSGGLKKDAVIGQIGLVSHHSRSLLGAIE